MEIKEYKGDVLKSGADLICHQVNCLGIMGGGLAKQVKEQYPMVYNDYKFLCDLHKKDGKTKDLLGYAQFLHMEDKEFKMGRKNCCMCVHYCSLVNQGMWWCKKDHTEDMNPEICGDYDEVKLRASDVTATSSSYETLKSKFESVETYKDIMVFQDQCLNRRNRKQKRIVKNKEE